MQACGKLEKRGGGMPRAVCTRGGYGRFLGILRGGSKRGLSGAAEAFRRGDGGFTVEPLKKRLSGLAAAAGGAA